MPNVITDSYRGCVVKLLECSGLWSWGIHDFITDQIVPSVGFETNRSAAYVQATNKIDELYARWASECCWYLFPAGMRVE